MKEFVLIMVLILPGQEPQIKKFPMPSLEVCLDAVKSKLEQVEQIQDEFRFSAGCGIMNHPTGEAAQ